MHWLQKFLYITVILTTAFIIRLTLHETSFFSSERMKPINQKVNTVSPIQHKSKGKRTGTHNSNENKALSNEITVLTAYFNIGSFAKGSKDNVYTPAKYRKWMEVFGRINNKLIMYTDDNTTYNLFKSLRGSFPKDHTQLFMINRTDLWSFQISDNISRIYKQPGYPHHYPNTVLPGYSCAMHAKFELLAGVIKRNYFKTKYFMWLDIGLFRHLKGSFKFGLSVPRDFNDSKVAYSFVNKFQNLDYKEIVYKNMVWIGGASNLGRSDVLYTFTQEYLDFVKKSLLMKLMDTDQQIIYGMYAKKRKPITQLQLYRSGWFELGYRCYKEWQQAQNKTENPNSKHNN